MASLDPQVREEAPWELCSNICHQGTIYEATAYALPFIIRHLTDPMVPDKVYLLCYLAYMARDCTQLSSIHEVQTLQAIKEGIPIYLHLLNQGDIIGLTISVCKVLLKSSQSMMPYWSTKSDGAPPLRRAVKF
ncbi:MAG: hypothetical protein HC880_04575 [Bacteroidia bacterium]|nr:hypothetical protein [Bacteroidia bacterium]